MRHKIKHVVTHRFSRFFYGGILNYGLKLGVTALLTELLHIWYFTSYVISLISVIIFSFFYNAYITYGVKEDKRNNFIKYVIFLGIFMIIDAASVRLLTDYLGLYYLLSITSVTIVLFFAKYFAYGKMVFRKREFKNVAGNYFDKHHSKNPIVKFLMRRFHDDLFGFIRLSKAKSVLDVGCGEGYTTRLIKKEFPRLSLEGNELEESALRIARKENPSIVFNKGSIYEIKKKTGSFDLVVASEVLEHVQDPDKAITETRRVAKDYCIFSVPYEPFWRMANMARFAYLSDFGNTPGHINHWTKSGFRKLLKPHFKKVTVKNSFLWNIALCEK